jgi:hypothetical protein
MVLLRVCLAGIAIVLVGCRCVDPAGELGTLKTMTTIHDAEAQRYSRYGRFAGSLLELTSVDATLLELARTGESSGYKFTLSLTARGYTINATPILFGTTGTRAFFSDQTLEIHERHGPEPASASDPLLK